MDFLLIPLNSSTYGIPTWIPLLQFLKQTDTKYLCTTEKFTWCRTWSHSWLLLLIILFLEINKCHCLRRQKKYAALIPPNIVVIACCCRMFTDSCKRMRIMKSSEAIGLGMGFLSFLVPFLFLFSFCDYYGINWPLLPPQIFPNHYEIWAWIEMPIVLDGGSILLIEIPIPNCFCFDQLIESLQVKLIIFCVVIMAAPRAMEKCKSRN